MAVYKIFPSKDTYLDENLSTNNFGRDEVLEISSLDNNLKRILIEFNQDEINTVLALFTGSYKTNLKLYLAEANNIPIDYTLEFLEVSSSWEMGTGRNLDSTNPKNGATWIQPSPLTSSSINWNGGSTVGSAITQSFSYRDNKDIKVDITSFVSSSIPNGILIKNTDAIESSSADITLKYFGVDTHTIYPPELEIRWNDVNYSSSLTTITSNNFVTKITNKNIYKEDEVSKVRILCRDRFPAREFTTSSVYLNNKILPSESYWAIKDVKTDETVVGFDTIGNEVGADNESNYFTLYCNGLEPERYYQFILKTKIDGEEIIVDDSYSHFIIKK